MSTILKALRRLEQDRAIEATPSLEAAVLAEATPAATRRRMGWIVGALAAAAVGGAAVLVLERSGVLPEAPTSLEAPSPTRASHASDAGGPETGLRPWSLPPIAAAPPVRDADGTAPEARASSPIAGAPPPPPAAPADVLAPASPASAAPPVVAAGAPEALPVDPAAQRTAEALAVATAQAELAAVDRFDAMPSAPSRPPTPAAPVPLAAADPREEAIERMPAPLGSSRDAATPVRVARIEPRSPAPKPALPERTIAGSEVGAIVAEPVTRGHADEDEGVRAAPPARRRSARAAPATAGIFVLRTVWHPRPERRTALLSTPGSDAPREYHEGEHIGSLTLLRIEPSGVVFERDGVEIREKLTARP